MTSINKVVELEETKISVKVKLSTLWVTIMLLYIYADILSLFKPGQVGKMLDGFMGPFPATQASLLTAAIMMIIPAVMVFLSLTLKSKVNRWVNVIVGVLYMLVSISNLIGETWVYYLLFGAVEIICTLLIVRYAWNWPNSES